MLSLQEMSDRLEIDMLLDRYAAAVDRKQLDLLDTIFVPDVVFDFSMWPGGSGVKSLADLRAFCSQLGPGSQHINANKEIELGGDTARGRILCLNPHVITEETQPGGANLGFHGIWYIDEYVRTPDGWRISYRSEERSFSAFVTASIMHPVA
jgi:hypothetical protein